MLDIKHLNGIRGQEINNQLKNMKKVLLIFSLLLAFGTVQAQEGSDATLKEVKYWMENIGENLIKPYETFHEITFIIDKEKFTIKANKNDETKRLFTAEIRFSKLIKIELDVVDNRIVFRAKTNSINYTDTAFTPIGQTNSQDIFFDDSESANRFFKALKHYFSFFDYEIEFINGQDINNKF